MGLLDYFKREKPSPREEKGKRTLARVTEYLLRHDVSTVPAILAKIAEVVD
jgi:hypothetical protein